MPMAGDQIAYGTVDLAYESIQDAPNHINASRLPTANTGSIFCMTIPPFRLLSSDSLISVYTRCQAVAEGVDGVNPPGGRPYMAWGIQGGRHKLPATCGLGYNKARKRTNSPVSVTEEGKG